MRCYRNILGITYLDRITNVTIRNTVKQHIGDHQDLVTIVKKRKLQWFGHVIRSDGMAKTILQGYVEGNRRRGRPKKSWINNIEDWTELSLAEAQIIARDRKAWRRLVLMSSAWRPNDSSQS